MVRVDAVLNGLCAMGLIGAPLYIVYKLGIFLTS